jgi:hypothetical protein
MEIGKINEALADNDAEWSVKEVYEKNREQK